MSFTSAAKALLKREKNSQQEVEELPEVAFPYAVASDLDPDSWKTPDYGTA